MQKFHMFLIVFIYISPLYVIAQTFSGQHVISTSATGAWRAYSGDIDNDGDMDVLSVSYLDAPKIAWYENINGKGSFGSENIISSQFGGGGAITTGDVDNDGYTDVIYVSSLHMAAYWLRNIGGQGTFSELKTIVGPPNTDHPFHIQAADFDGDNDLDILIADNVASTTIYWLENTDALGKFGSIKPIATQTQAQGTYNVYTADLDNDGDIDVLSASPDDNKIAWYTNNGNGSFIQKVISTQARGANSVSAHDIDNDGDMDVLSTSGDDNKVAWYSNLDGNGTFSAQIIISTSMTGAFSAFAADIGNDNDLDVIAFGDNKIAWFENTNGKGEFSTLKIIDTPDDPTSIHITDLDNDNDVDILASIRNTNKIVWYENLTITTSIREKQLKQPQGFCLNQNYPNPFNPSTTICFTLQKPEHVLLKIYNIVGKEVAELINGVRSAGEHQVPWQANGLPSGIYLARLQSRTQIKTKKLILQK